MALLLDLEAGEDDLFAYGNDTAASRLSAWPLPPALRADGDFFRALPVPPDRDGRLEIFRMAQEPLLLGDAEAGLSGQTVRNREKALKKQAALRAKLAAEKERLLSVLARREEARLLQANLWRYAPDARHGEIRIEEAGRADGVSIALNPRLTLKENMEALFRQSGRAKRGLAHLEARLEALADGRNDPVAAPRSGPAPHKGGGAAAAGRPAKTTWAEFLSTDGFPMQRGRNAQGNRDVLRQARPHDLWFHVQDGPGAHLVLKRHHAGHMVPEGTLREAAALAALKSDSRNDAAARVICAQVKDVKALKGGPPGAVTVRAVLYSLSVAPLPELEERLRKPA
jgi:hypothetical protein